MCIRDSVIFDRCLLNLPSPAQGGRKAVRIRVVAFVNIPGSFHNLRFVVFARGFHVRKRFVFIITLQIYI